MALKTGAYLMDAHALNAELGDEDFPIPAEEDINRVGPGTYVKIGIAFPPTWNHSMGATVAGERFWLRITGGSITSDGLQKVWGRVDNDLHHTEQHGVSCGELIEVQPRHILDTLFMPVYS